MPYFDAAKTTGKKRKRSPSKELNFTHAPENDPLRLAPEVPIDREAIILRLEKEINESRKHYNKITELLAIARHTNGTSEDSILAAVALCRVFCRLVIAGNLETTRDMPQSEILIVEWLRERQHDYVDILVGWLASDKEQIQTAATSLAMRLVGEEVKCKQSAWKAGVWPKVFAAIISSEAAVGEYSSKYFAKYNDLRIYSLQAIPSILSETPVDREQLISNTMDLLFELDAGNHDGQEGRSFYGSKAPNGNPNALSAKTLRKAVQEAWLSVLRSPLTHEQRKGILTNLVDEVVPWFSKAERLADFLTDSYNFGGSTSLLALSGVYHLITERNLDYPAFYSKLYSLLDDGLLNSKHRSRFFRLLDTFLSSTHLPAALVASFIKRLARLALHAPPSGIVVVVPWIYNMFKKHPQCAFLIQRLPVNTDEMDEWQEHGAHDPFDEDEPDPNHTGALESSIWEIETLQSHYHPNVATLAKIISEQFTKQSYNLEDFLDHSYNSMIGGELGKSIKKTPVVEYQIPKRVFTESETELNHIGTLLRQVMECDSDQRAPSSV